jgi:hypothetical protein
MNTPQRLVLMREHTRTIADTMATISTMDNSKRRGRAMAHVHDMLLVLTEDIETVQQELYGEKETS